jgi:predicted aldo/keto reductase-like oxidoreductase
VLKETGMRGQVYVATKIWLARDWNTGVFSVEDASRGPGATSENFNRMLDQSLERLQSSYVDILYIHACDNAGMVNFENTMNAAVKAKEAGKTRFIGVSVHAKVAEVIRAAVDAKVYDVVEAAFNFQREDRDEIAKAVEVARENGVGIVAMKTQGGARREGDPAAFNHKASLKWVLQHQGVSTTIPGMSTFEQLELNFSVMADLALTADEKEAVKMSGLDRGGFCQNCRACVPQCPNGVAVPEVMRAYLYAQNYGNLSHAEWTLGTLQADRGLAACGSCSGCKVDCSHGVDVASRIRKLGKQFNLHA